jgi:hypothetical protein
VQLSVELGGYDSTTYDGAVRFSRTNWNTRAGQGLEDQPEAVAVGELRPFHLALEHDELLS